MTEVVLSVFLKTPTETPDPNYRALIPLSEVRLIRQNRDQQNPVIFEMRDGKSIPVQGLWHDYYKALNNVALIANVATPP